MKRGFFFRFGHPIWLAVLLVLAVLLPSRGAAADKRPNVLFIVADDMQR